MIKWYNVFFWIRYRMRVILFGVMLLLLLIVWNILGLSLSSYSSVQSMLETITQLMIAFLGVILVVVTFVHPKLSEAKSNLKYYRLNLEKYFHEGITLIEKEGDVRENESDTELTKKFEIELIRQYLYSTIVDLTDNDIRKGLNELLLHVSIICAAIENEQAYRETVVANLINLSSNSYSKEKLEVFIDDARYDNVKFFECIEKIYVSYWFRPIAIPEIPLLQELFKDGFASTLSSLNLTIARLGNFVMGKTFSTILFLCSSMIVVSLLVLGILTEEYYSKSQWLHYLVGVIVSTAILTTWFVVEYVYEINRILRDNSGSE